MTWRLVAYRSKIRLIGDSTPRITLHYFYFSLYCCGGITVSGEFYSTEGECGRACVRRPLGLAMRAAVSERPFTCFCALFNFRARSRYVRGFY